MEKNGLMSWTASSRPCGDQPSLAEMTDKALGVLSKARAGRYAGLRQRDPDRAGFHTLIVVTADHDHAIAFNGYPKIGNPILGTVKSYADGKPALAADGKPYTTLVFGNGGRPNADATARPTRKTATRPGSRRRAARDDLSNVNT